MVVCVIINYKNIHTVCVLSRCCFNCFCEFVQSSSSSNFKFQIEIPIFQIWPNFNNSKTFKYIFILSNIMGFPLRIVLP